VERGGPSNKQINEDLLRPILTTTWRFWATVLIFGSILLAAVLTFAYQVRHGIGVTGKNWPVMWSFYITNFVFWIGISHAGTLISAILRLVKATWRRPITRCAEAITVFALIIGSMFPIVHLGRPWLFFWLVPYPNDRMIWPNFRSPLMWDFMAINTYLIGSLTYLYLPMVPDLAVVRDRSTGLRRRIYGLLSLGWQGTATQWNRLERAISIMAIIIVPVAVSVHTIVSWDFSMTLNPMWKSTIFGPYFVVGAIFSGIAALILAMAVLRRMLRLEPYLKPLHFDNLGKLLLTMSCLWFYFTFAEYLTVWYNNEPHEIVVFWSKVSGPYAPLFWSMMTCCFVIPMIFLGIHRFRTVAGTAIASFAIVIGMWIERFLIIVPTLAYPRLHYIHGSYTPRWVEITITIGTFGYFALLYLVFIKFFPIISIWELKEGYHEERRRSHGTIPGIASPEVEGLRT
jgi:molybdopterin-containing oxidoreductase family membrane subunit